MSDYRFLADIKILRQRDQPHNAFCGLPGVSLASGRLSKSSLLES